MIDRFLYAFFGGLDRLCEAVANKLAGPRCLCKKNSKRTYKHKKDHGTDISFENEINNGK